MAAARKRAARFQGVRRNPAELVMLGANPREDAEEGLEEFQGREPEEILEFDETQRMPKYTFVLGDLVALGFGDRTAEGERLTADQLSRRWKECSNLSFAGDDVKLAGLRQKGIRNFPGYRRAELFCVGGDQRLSPEAIDLIESGPCYFIVYDTKKQQDGFVDGRYTHSFGERAGRRPTIYFDEDAGRVLIRGGSYEIDDRGIVN